MYSSGIHWSDGRVTRPDRCSIWGGAGVRTWDVRMHVPSHTYIFAVARETRAIACSSGCAGQTSIRSPSVPTLSQLAVETSGVDVGKAAL